MTSAVQKSDSYCDSLGIPSYLHQNNQSPIQIFDPQEKIYRRFPLKDEDGEDTIIVNPSTNEKILSLSVIKIDTVSCIRQKFSQSPDDVLYNNKTSNHFFENHGIFELIVDDIHSWKFEHPTDNTIFFTLKVIHDPDKCIYPHVNIDAFKNGNPPSIKVKPNTVRDKIKGTFQSASKIISPQ